MIKIFRKIRQNLLMEKKTSKYFKYAIGEIVLVVIGILIALQINNWNEIRKERNQAFQYLSEFKKDIVSDTVQYNYVITEHYKNIKAHIALLSKVNITLNDIEDIKTSMGSVYYSRKINIKTFQKTQNNGTSNLLGFEDIYDLLSNYYTETSRKLVYQCEWEVKDYDKNRALFDNFIIENNYEIGLLIEDFKKEFQIESFPKRTKNQEDNFILKFLNSVRGRNYIRFALNRNYYMKNHYEEYRDEALTLLNEIDKAIQSHD